VWAELEAWPGKAQASLTDAVEKARARDAAAFEMRASELSTAITRERAAREEAEAALHAHEREVAEQISFTHDHKG
jgi:hypothetical protein